MHDKVEGGEGIYCSHSTLLWYIGVGPLKHFSFASRCSVCLFQKKDWSVASHGNVRVAAELTPQFWFSFLPLVPEPCGPHTATPLRASAHLRAVVVVAPAVS